MANKSSLLIVASALLLAGSIFFSYSAKKSFLQTTKEIKQNSSEIIYTQDLQRLWRPKGIKSKLQNGLKSINFKGYNIEKNKIIVNSKNLNYRDLNNALNKLASLPLKFEELKITRNGENFNLECLCDW